jgi:hypothetical protein
MRLTLSGVNHFYMLRTLRTNRNKTMLIDELRVVYMPYAWPVKKVLASFGAASAGYPYTGKKKPIDSALYAVFASPEVLSRRDEFSLEAAKHILQQAASRKFLLYPELREFIDNTTNYEKRIYAKTISLEPLII